MSYEGLRVIVLSLALIWPSAPAASECIPHIIKAELEYGIPSGLLLAISQVESSLQPWAVNLNGKSYYPETRKGAERLLLNKDGTHRKGHTAVGCMQLAVRWHKQAFETSYHMLEPAANVDYGAKFLKSLYKRYGSWKEAIKHYHGGTVLENKVYFTKVKRRWGDK